MELGEAVDERDTETVILAVAERRGEIDWAELTVEEKLSVGVVHADGVKIPEGLRLDGLGLGEVLEVSEKEIVAESVGAIESDTVWRGVWEEVSEEVGKVVGDSVGVVDLEKLKEGVANTGVKVVVSVLVMEFVGETVEEAITVLETVAV